MDISAQSQSVNRSENIFECADRTSPGDSPRDITEHKELYLPLDVFHKATHIRRNPFGVAIYKVNVGVGNVYHSYDGKRLVLEVGCQTIIYILINPRLPGQHHRLFIQSDAGFSVDTTIRRDAADIARNTRHVETLVKYEMYFIMGALSTLGWAAWLAVTGSDVTFLYGRHKVVADAAKVLAESVLKELSEVKSYAPTLYAKIWALITQEALLAGNKSVSGAPETALKSEKVQAQVAGVIFGKWSLPDVRTFSTWSLIATLLGQVAMKSAIAYPAAYMQVVDKRYTPLVNQLQAIDMTNASSIFQPIQSLAGLLRESGLVVTGEELSVMLREIKAHTDKAYKNLSSIVGAVETFRRVVNK